MRAVAIVPYIILWGPDGWQDMLRRAARCVFGLADWYRDDTLAEYVPALSRRLAAVPGRPDGADAAD